jgi:ribonuclease VapC
VIVDSSALVAIVRAEPDAPRYAAALVSTNRAAMSAVNYVEAAVVVDSARDPVASRRFDELVKVAGIDVVEVTAEQAILARQAYRDFGRGSTSPARLNFGDCFAYALAAQRREPLLFKGADFIHTDLVAADLPDQ